MFWVASTRFISKYMEAHAHLTEAEKIVSNKLKHQNLRILNFERRTKSMLMMLGFRNIPLLPSHLITFNFYQIPLAENILTLISFLIIADKNMAFPQNKIMEKRKSSSNTNFPI